MEETLTPVISAVGVAPQVLALVGPSRGYRLQTDRITLSGTDAVEVSKRGVDDATVVVTALDGTVYTLTDDYVVATTPGANTPYDDVTTIAREGTGTIADPEVVFVSYRYADLDFVAPQRFVDLDSIEAFYGPALDTATGTIISPLTLAARIARANGASEVVTVSVPTTAGAVSAAGLASAYATLNQFIDIGVVVGMPVGLAAPGPTTAIADLEAHVQAASDDDRFCVGVFGVETDVATDPVTLAAAASSRRVVLAHPNRLLYFNGETNQTFEVGGYYLAAAYGGQLISRLPQHGLTRKSIRGFAGVPGEVVATMTRSTKNTWSNGGVAVAEVDRDSRLVVRHGVTTDSSTVLTREVSVVRGRDAMVAGVKTSLDRSGLIGSPIDQDTVLRVKGVVDGALVAALDSGVIAGYRDLKARMVSTDPTICEVKCFYTPAYPLNYLVFSFSVDVQSGEFSLTEPSAA